jgi:hypothetical protein
MWTGAAAKFLLGIFSLARDFMWVSYLQKLVLYTRFLASPLATPVI